MLRFKLSCIGMLYSWDSFQLDRKNILIYGAGKAGAQISESLKKSNDYNVVGFIDDDKSKISLPDLVLEGKDIAFDIKNNKITTFEDWKYAESRLK